jgi:hypothetical protein
MRTAEASHTPTMQFGVASVDATHHDNQGQGQGLNIGGNSQVQIHSVIFQFFVYDILLSSALTHVSVLSLISYIFLLGQDGGQFLTYCRNQLK